MTDNKPRFFLIGGTGFLGGAFNAFLTSRGHLSTIIKRDEISNGKMFEFDTNLLKKFELSKGGRNIVIDFAYTSVPNTNFADPIKDFAENLHNVNSHLIFASHLPNVSYIYISSGGTVYGNVPSKQPIKESCENFPLSPYGIVKLSAEKYALMFKAIHGINVQIIRPANVYGPGQKPMRGQGFIATAIAMGLKELPLQIYGDGSIVRDYVYIADFCDALLKIVLEANSGIYNIGSAVGITINELLSIITSLGVDVKTEYFPARPFDVTFNILNNDLLKSLNWRNNTTIEDGIFETLKWIKKYLGLD